MFDQQWNKVYQNKGMAAYPDNALIRFVAKNYYDAPIRDDIKFLDVGCGAGASTWYLAREGFNVTAIDGSEIALNRLKERLKLEELDAGLVHGDVSEIKFQSSAYDCAVDISSLCYIPENKIERTLGIIYASLKAGGRLFSIAPTDESATEPFETMGGADIKARFLSKSDLLKLFKNFKTVAVTGYSYTVSSGKQVKLWAIDAQK
jgi:ubiquinone/menaquinone biosynthesis C-methylase UbiE